MVPIALVLSIAALGGAPEHTAMADCTLQLHRTYARIIYLERDKLTRRALSHAEGLRRCLPGPHSRRLALKLTRRLRERRRLVRSVKVKLDAIAVCESHGDYGAISASGTFRGRYQFDYGTWRSVGGKGDPAKAEPHEQDYRAALLLTSRGTAPWPVCG